MDPPCTVLVIDDDVATAAFLRTALDAAGYRMLYGLGAAALALAQAEHPAVILLDVEMPDLDGPEMARRLRADPQTALIPIISMSARYPPDPLPQMPREAHLAKPFALALLYATLTRWTAGQDMVTPAPHQSQRRRKEQPAP